MQNPRLPAADLQQEKRRGKNEKEIESFDYIVHGSYEEKK
jgi:hypothetical protein